MPKQYQMLGARTMLEHAVEAVLGDQRIERVLIVVAPSDGRWARIGFDRRVAVATVGGDSRAESVRNGLKVLPGVADNDWVLVHDAARCLITPELIDRLIDSCGKDEVGGLLAHPLADTLKIGEDGRVAGTIDRGDKWQAQTPQMFRLGMLRQALEAAGDEVTDESSAIEKMGLKPLLVEAGAQNFKVTYPEDFAMAEAVLRGRAR